MAIKPPSLDLRFDQGVPVLVLHETADIEGLRASIRAFLPGHMAAIGGRAARLELGSREVNLFDLRRVIHMLKQEHGLEITGLYLRSDAIHRFAERELKLKLFPNDPAPAETADAVTEEVPAGAGSEGAHASSAGATEPREPAEPGEELELDVLPLRNGVTPHLGLRDGGGPMGAAALPRVTLPHDLRPDDIEESAPPKSLYSPVPDVSWPEGTPAPTGSQHLGPGHGLASAPVPGRSHTVHRTLRSGAVARFDGDLYVFGDVNPGAHVIATGNITVLGALKGVAHAGAAGDESCFIMAFDLRPTQLRIGRKIAVPPPRPPGAPVFTEQASVEDGQIVIAPYAGGGSRQPGGRGSRNSST